MLYIHPIGSKAMCEKITLMDYKDEQGSRFMSVRQEKDGTLVFT